MATFATAFPTTAPTTPNASTSLKRRMSPHANVWPEYDVPVATTTTMMLQSQAPQQAPPQLQLQQQPSFKRARLSHSSPGELCLQRDLKSLSHSHQWNHQSHTACWVYGQDPNIRLHKACCNGEQQLLLEFSQDANILIEIPRMYPHQTPRVTKIQGLWMDSILIRQHATQHQQQQQQQQQNNCFQTATTAKTVVFDQWSPIINLSTLLEFCIHHAKMHPSLAHAKLPATLYERTNTLHHNNHIRANSTTTATKSQYHHHQQQQQHHQSAGNSENNHHHAMDVSHPCKYTSPFAPNRMDVGYNKQQESSASYYNNNQQAPSQDAMEM